MFSCMASNVLLKAMEASKPTTSKKGWRPPRIYPANSDQELQPPWLLFGFTRTSTRTPVTSFFHTVSTSTLLGLSRVTTRVFLPFLSLAAVPKTGSRIRSWPYRVLTRDRCCRQRRSPIRGPSGCHSDQDTICLQLNFLRSRCFRAVSG
jgi:hypothetical protein